jgi:hypothetical protein
MAIKTTVLTVPDTQINKPDLKDAALTWYFENEEHFLKYCYSREDIVSAAFSACFEYLKHTQR